jgi:hypothetical protein
MKHILQYSTALLLIFAVTFAGAQTKQPKKQEDPVINFRLSLPQASTLIYAIRYTTILDAKSANELADLLVAQSNDTTLNKRIAPPVEKPKSK